jgi:hypothetical protein
VERTVNLIFLNVTRVVVVGEQIARLPEANGHSAGGSMCEVTTYEAQTDPAPGEGCERPRAIIIPQPWPEQGWRWRAR